MRGRFTIVDIETKVLSQYSLLILKQNSQFYVNKTWCTTLMDHPVGPVYIKSTFLVLGDRVEPADDEASRREVQEAGD